MLLTSHYVVARRSSSALALLALAAWHWQEPERSRMSAVTPYPRRRAKPNGWWGMALFVATEATLFGTLIGSVLLPALQARALAAAGSAGAGGRCCRSS